MHFAIILGILSIPFSMIANGAVIPQPLDVFTGIIAGSLIDIYLLLDKTREGFDEKK